MDIQDVTMANFEQGVAVSPYKGHSLMRNVDINNFNGSMRAKNGTLNTIVGCQTVTFSVDTANDWANAATTTMDTQSNLDQGVNYNYVAVTFSTTGSLPGGLSINTIYFLIRYADNTFRVATSFYNAKNNTYIDITSTGTGVHTVTPVSIGTIKHIRANMLKISIPESAVAYFAIDSNGRVWFSESSITNPFYLLKGNSIGSNTHGNGLEVFYTSDLSAVYLFTFLDDQVEVINVTAQTNIYTPVWTTGWKTLNTPAGLPLVHPSLLGQDNIIYFGDGRYVGSIIEKAGQVFDPATSATYTFNSTALALPANEYAYCLSELNINLLTGGARSNLIYPWDRSSVSYNLPLRVPEVGVFGMVNVGNVVVIAAGTYGKLYKTQGSYVTDFASIPSYIMNNTTTTLITSTMQWGGMAVRNGKILIGASFAQNSAASGLYLVFPDGRIVQDETPVGGAQIVTAIYSVSENGFLIGYAGGIDKLNTTKSTAGSYYAVYQSQFFRVGNFTQKKKFSQLEVQTGRSQGGRIRASYRTDLSASFTTLVTWTTPSSSGGVSFNVDIGAINLENIQIQLEFDNNIEIIEATLYS